MQDTDQSTRLHLRLMATTDLHMHLHAWDYAADCPAPGLGLAALVPVIQAARNEAANSLLFDNGDFLQGCAIGDLAAREGAAGRMAVNPMIVAMNDMRYDAGTLGNHDVSHGLPLLLSAVDAARHPVVSANLIGDAPHNLFDDDATPSHTLLPPWTILDRTMVDQTGQPHRLRIGVTGALPPQTALWERRTLDHQARVGDILPAIRDAVAGMRAEGADVVVVLAHSGIGPAAPEPGMENAGLVLAGLDGVDALILGHTHHVFPGPNAPTGPGIDAERGLLAGKPAVMAGAFGAQLGVIDLWLDRDATGGWRVTDGHAACRPAATETETAPLPEPVTAAHRQTLDWVRGRIGRVDTAMTSHFALIAPSTALRLLALAKGRHVAEALQNGPHGRLPVLSAAAPFRSGGRAGPRNYTDIAAGEMQFRHVLDLCPHPNTITALRLTGAELANWLERAAGLFHQIVPGGQDQQLIDPDFPPFNFDIIDGLDFSIDLSAPSRFDTRGRLIAPEAQRITDLNWRGTPIDPKASFIVATNNYRSNGGMGFAGTDPTRLVLDEGTPVRDVLVAHVRDRGTRLPPSASGWRFRPMPGTTVTFLTSPEAAHHLHTLPDPVPEPLGLTSEGFLRFRLRL